MKVQNFRKRMKWMKAIYYIEFKTMLKKFSGKKKNLKKDMENIKNEAVRHEYIN